MTVIPKIKVQSILILNQKIYKEGIMKLHYLILIILTLLLTGCFGSIKKTFIDTYADGYDGLAIEADKRLVLATQQYLKNAKGEFKMKKNEEDEDAYETLPVICAEPPPDAGSERGQKANLGTPSHSVSITGSPEAGIPGGSKSLGSGSIGFESFRNVNLLPQNHVVKFYRDGIFSLCQAAMNGWVDTVYRNRNCSGEKGFIKEFAGKDTPYGCTEFEVQMFKLRKAAVDMVQGPPKAVADAEKARLSIFNLKLTELKTLIATTKDPVLKKKYEEARDRLLGVK